MRQYVRAAAPNSLRGLPNRVVYAMDGICPDQSFDQIRAAPPHETVADGVMAWSDVNQIRKHFPNGLETQW